MSTDTAQANQTQPSVDKKVFIISFKRLGRKKLSNGLLISSVGFIY